MTDEQTANVVKAINDTLAENKATLGDTIWILSSMAVRFIETTADKSAHNILKMELAQAIMKSTTMTPLGQIVDLPPLPPMEINKEHEDGSQNNHQ